MGIEYLDKKRARLVYSSGTGKNRIRRVKRITYNGKKDAERQYQEFCESLKNTVDSSISVGDLLDWYIESFKESGGKATTVRAYKTSAKAVKSFFKRRKASSITLYDIDTFIRSEAKIRAPKTIRNEVSLLMKK